MSEKNVAGFLLPEINLVDVIDKALQKEIDRDTTGTSQRVFDYYNSPQKPLTNREFIQFWGSLTLTEMTEYYEHFFV